LVVSAAAVLTFFIAGLLYLLRFERVDNLGAYSIPSETGLLIPSDYARLAIADSKRWIIMSRMEFSRASSWLVSLAILFVPAGLVAYFTHNPKWLTIVPFGIITAALLIAALPITRKVTPELWASELEPHLLGTDGPWDWDDATSVALADPRLEAIRGTLVKFDALTTEEKRKEFEAIIAALKRGEIPEVSDDCS
jgi:hypothetical protein